jgi:hypothetical protein
MLLLWKEQTTCKEKRRKYTHRKAKKHKKTEKQKAEKQKSKKVKTEKQRNKTQKNAEAKTSKKTSRESQISDSTNRTAENTRVAKLRSLKKWGNILWIEIYRVSIVQGGAGFLPSTQLPGHGDAHGLWGLHSQGGEKGRLSAPWRGSKQHMGV